MTQAEKTSHTLHCQDPWFSLMKNGKKLVEGRKNSAKNSQIKAGDTIVFYFHNEQFLTQVTEVRKYVSLEAYLHDVTVEKALPGIPTFEEAVHTYLQWNSQEEIEELGFLGIFIKVLLE